MKTLINKEWEVKINQLYLIAESIVNHNTSVDTIVLEIQKLDKNQMVLKLDNQIFIYKKSLKTTTLKAHFIYEHEVSSFSPCVSDKDFWISDKTEKLKSSYEKFTVRKEPYTPIFRNLIC